ncbi:hypothetical protein [Nocardiopsis oceani]
MTSILFLLWMRTAEKGERPPKLLVFLLGLGTAMMITSLVVDV